MSFVAVAIGGGSLAVAGAGVYGASKAADAQTSAANAALQVQQQAQQNFKPYLDTGKAATYSLSSLLGLPGQDGTTKAPDYSSFYNSPDYQFAQQQGELGINRANAATGNQLSGGTLKDLASFNSGLASQQYGNYFSRLMGLSQMGQASAAGAASGANAMGNTIQAGGQAQASGYVGAANAIGSGVNSGISNSLLSSYLNKNPSAYGAGSSATPVNSGNYDVASMGFVGI